MDEVLLGQKLQDLLHVLQPEALAGAKRQLECRALEVIEQDVQVVGIHQGVFGRRVEEIRRVAQHELVDGRAAADHHRRRSALSPARATGTLPRRRDRPRIAGHHRDVQRSDVDAELERVGGHHCAHLSLAQPPLDLAPAKRQVPAPIAADLLGCARGSLEIVLQIRGQDLGRQSALTEDDQLQLPLEELPSHAPRLGEVRPPDAEFLVDDGWIDEQEQLLAARRAAVVDEREGLLRQPLGQLARIRDSRRRTDEDRVRPVVAADALQAAQHVGQVTAEHAAIGVELVDDDEAEVLEQLRPLGVVRQDPRVQHVGVAQHDVRARANRAARVLRGVAVVREDADLGLGRLVHVRRQLVKLGQLVLGQRLGRKQIDRAG